MTKRTFIKDVRSQAGGGCPVLTFLGLGRFFRCGRPNFCYKKNPDFLVNFFDFVRTSFMNGL